MFKRRRKKSTKVVWTQAPDIFDRMKDLIEKVGIDWVKVDQVYCIRSSGSSARAYARMWGMGKIWQVAAGIQPSYCLEVVSEYFDKLPKSKQDHVILHELAHIPSTFSGALLAHTHGKGGFHDKLRTMIAIYSKLDNK